MLRIFIFLIIVGTFSSCASKFSKILKSTDYEYKYKMAEKYYVEKKYSNAQILFEDLFPVYKGTPKYEDLYFKYAFTAYNQRDYVNAENLFKTFVETFPNSPKAEEADYMRAYSYFKQSPKAALDQTNTAKAMGQMQVFINTHPGSQRVFEATQIIEQSRTKMETKDFLNAQLYFNLGYFKAAAIAFSSLIDNFPDTNKGDEYKLMVIKSYYQYAKMSVEERQAERFDKVVVESQDFNDRFPDSKLLKTVENYKSLSLNNIKLNTK